MSRVVFASFIFFGTLAAGCASTVGGPCPHCDLGGGGGEPVDLSGEAPPDLSGDFAHVLGQFGDPCTSAAQCQSQYCVFSGISGICTVGCPPACAPGYGCYSVLGGGIDPGQVVSICVPENNELCSPCNLSSECSSAGKDLCLPGPLGGNFCARDCTNVSCPTGFSCNTLNLSGITVMQCQPTVGSCDCHLASQAAMTVNCPITTPFGTCQGSHTCGGVTGWSACAPPSATDVPDSAYADDNCDGIDGDITAGIFVATTGTDGPTCGLVYTSPCRTVNEGLVRAVIDSKKYVYVQAGIYTEVVTLQAGKTVVGGYDLNWQRAARTVGGHESRIVGALDPTSGQYVAVTGTNVTVDATLMDLVVQGPDVPAFAAGKSSYAIYLSAAKLDFQRVTVIGGNGADGSDGSNAGGYSNPNATATMNGTKGGDSNNSCEVCNDSTRGGGGPHGANSCSGGAVSTNGGDGGAGGTKDSSCCGGQCAVICGDCNATNGLTGANAAQTFFGVYGLAGGGSGTCATGNGGNGGLVQNGNGGTAGGARGAMLASYWNALKGGDGQLGDHGSGGGGGGGTGACDNGCDSDGAGGGGGGAGGCRSPDAGGGGLGGGGSFGVFAVAGSTVNASDCAVQRGNGGHGGHGGAGGRGQAGGGGNSGGNSAGGSQAGGVGGDGAHGGHGGAGAGGSGGISAAFANSTSTVNQSCALSGGAAGGGGVAGARPAASDGADGATGASGAVYDTFSCGASGGC